MTAKPKPRWGFSLNQLLIRKNKGSRAEMRICLSKEMKARRPEKSTNLTRKFKGRI